MTLKQMQDSLRKIKERIQLLVSENTAGFETIKSKYKDWELKVLAFLSIEHEPVTPEQLKPHIKQSVALHEQAEKFVEKLTLTSEISASPKKPGFFTMRSSSVSASSSPLKDSSAAKPGRASAPVLAPIQEVTLERKDDAEFTFKVINDFQALFKTDAEKAKKLVINLATENSAWGVQVLSNAKTSAYEIVEVLLSDLSDAYLLGVVERLFRLKKSDNFRVAYDLLFLLIQGLHNREHESCKGFNEKVLKALTDFNKDASAKFVLNSKYTVVLVESVSDKRDTFALDTSLSEQQALKEKPVLRGYFETLIMTIFSPTELPMLIRSVLKLASIHLPSSENKTYALWMDMMQPIVLKQLKACKQFLSEERDKKLREKSVAPAIISIEFDAQESFLGIMESILPIFMLPEFQSQNTGIKDMTLDNVQDYLIGDAGAIKLKREKLSRDMETVLDGLVLDLSPKTNQQGMSNNLDDVTRVNQVLKLMYAPVESESSEKAVAAVSPTQNIGDKQPIKAELERKLSILPPPSHSKSASSSPAENRKQRAVTMSGGSPKLVSLAFLGNAAAKKAQTMQESSSSSSSQNGESRQRRSGSVGSATSGGDYSPNGGSTTYKRG